VHDYLTRWNYDGTIERVHHAPSRRHTRPSINTSMTGYGTSFANDTKRKGVVWANSPVSTFTGPWPCDAFDASAGGRRRGP
jgi:hypothetical protein